MAQATAAFQASALLANNRLSIIESYLNEDAVIIPQVEEVDELMASQQRPPEIITLDGLKTRHEELSIIREDFRSAVALAVEKKVLVAAINRQQFDFDELFYRVSSKMVGKITTMQGQLPSSHLPDREVASIENRLKAMETLYRASCNTLTVCACDELIKDFKCIKLDHNSYVDQALQREISQDHQRSLLRDQATFIQRIETIIIEILSVKDGLLDQRRAENGANNSSDYPKIRAIELDKFDGNRLRWTTFRDTFKGLIHENPKHQKIAKFKQLQLLITDPLCPIKNSIPTEAGYDDAWKRVNDFYDDDRQTIHQNLNEILGLKTITEESYPKIQLAVNNMQTNVQALKRLAEEKNYDVADFIFGHLLFTKMDCKTQELWNVHNDNKVTLYSELAGFLESRAKSLQTQAPAKKAFEPRPVENKPTFKTIYSHATQQQNHKSKCGICQMTNHRTSKCQKFLKMSVSERASEVQKNSLCSNCLGFHSSSSCTSSNVCRAENCGQKHHTMLHGVPTTIVNVGALGEAPVIFSTAIINIRGIDERQSHQIRSMSDTGSQSCFIRRCVVDALHLKTRPVNILGYGVTGNSFWIREAVTAVILGNNKQFTLEFLVVNKIIKSKIPTHPIDVSQLSLPNDISLADPNFYQPAEIDVLLGNEIAKKIETGQKFDLPSGLTIFNTIFGWSIAGKISSPEPSLSIKVTRCNLGTLNDLRESIEKFYKIEDYRNSKKFYSAEETHCEEFFQQTFKRKADGRFIIKIPFKPEVNQIVNNYRAALSQFLQTEKRLQRNQQLRQEYVDFMREYESLGHMSVVDVTNESHQIQAYYLPHHPVFKPGSTTTSTRVVFNGSSKTKSGHSLNDVQHVGPSIQPDSAGLIIRLRQYIHVVKGDISKFYRQIEVSLEQRKFQRILWRESPSDQLKVYQLNTITYGTSSASFQSTRCLKQLAIDHRDQYPAAAQALENGFFVDDLITGADTPSEAFKLYQDITKILSSAGMALRKFISNSSEFINMIPAEDRETPDQNSVFKALGVKWDPISDCIGFDIAEIPSPKFITKRSVLSAIAKPMALDPTGLISPFTLKFKMFMRQVHKLKIAWDDKLDDHFKNLWLNMIRPLSQANEIKIPRLVLVEQNVKIQLHCFSDASMEALGSCVYMRCVKASGAITSNLIYAKSRLSSEGTSMPRLELCSSVVGAHLMDFASENSIKDVDSKFCWSDSMIALYWMLSCPSKLPIFIANRVHEIQTLSQKHNINWRHVPGEINPADIVSRSMDLDDLMNIQLWWHGPEFLLQREEQWPNTLIEFDVNAPEHQAEVQRVQVLTTRIEPDNSNTIFKIVNESKSFYEAKRKLASLIRLVSNSRAKTANIPRNVDPIGHDELKNAEIVIAREYQKVFMPREYELLSQGKDIPPSSSYKQLSPFWHEKDQLVRVGGRLRNADVPFNQRHQILIPKCYLANVIILEAHDRLGHAGQRMTIAAVQSRYWPVHMKSRVRDVIHSCVECFQMNPKMGEQFMADLPKSRVTPARQFQTTGVDFAGPFHMKLSKLRNAKFDKAYLAIFVCFVSKAVHIELVPSLTTEDFIQALIRFTSRRGVPNEIWSDNAGTFSSCDKQLKKYIEGLIKNTRAVTDYLLKMEIRWKFIPPRAPQHGGLWEACVKSVKTLYYNFIRDAYLTFSEMYTVCCKVEAILNSRPISSLNDDPNDLSYLTPSHLCTGHPLVSLPEPNLGDQKMSNMTRYHRIIAIQQQFWRRFVRETFAQLQVRTKNALKKNDFHVGQMALMEIEHTPSMKWPLGKITAVHPGADGLVRVVTIKTDAGEYRRPVTKIAILPSQEEDNE